MHFRYIKSLPGIGKIAIIVFGVIILALGLTSHFDSYWRTLHKGISVYPGLTLTMPDGALGPAFTMEEYYVSMIIICFIFSLGSLGISVMIDTSKGVNMYADLGYHVLSAILLFIAGAVYIASGAEIRKLEQYFQMAGSAVNLRAGEKIAAGVLTIIHSLMNGGVGFLIVKGDKNASHPI